MKNTKPVGLVFFLVLCCAVVAIREFVDVDLLTIDIIVELDGIELALDILEGNMGHPSAHLHTLDNVGSAYGQFVCGSVAIFRSGVNSNNSHQRILLSFVLSGGGLVDEDQFIVGVHNLKERTLVFAFMSL